LGACHRPKHRDGARRFAADTPQVFYEAYISDLDSFYYILGKRVTVTICVPSLKSHTSLL